MSTGDNKETPVEGLDIKVLETKLKHLKEQFDETKKLFDKTYDKTKTELERLEKEREDICAKRGEQFNELKIQVIRIGDLVVTQANRLNEISSALEETDQDVDGLSARMDELYRDIEGLQEHKTAHNERLTDLESKSKKVDGYLIVGKHLGKLSMFAATITVPVIMVISYIKEIIKFFKALIGN